MVSTTKVKVKEPIVNGTAKEVKIDQPANSVIDAVFVHVVDDIVLDAVVDVTFKLGTSSNAAQFVAAAEILDGDDDTSAKKAQGGTIYKCSLVSGSDYSTPGASGSNTATSATLVTDARELVATITSGAGNAVSGSHGDIDIHVQFRHF